MRLTTYRANPTAAARLGFVAGDMVVDVHRLGEASGAALPSDMLHFIDLGPAAVAKLRDLAGNHERAWPVGAAFPLGNVKLLAPIPRPRKNIFGIGLN